MRIEIWNGKNCLLSIPIDFIPNGNNIVRECYETDTEIVVCGWPKEEHNCDQMGCSTINHVLYRFKK